MAPQDYFPPPPVHLTSYQYVHLLISNIGCLNLSKSASFSSADFPFINSPTLPHPIPAPPRSHGKQQICGKSTPEMDKAAFLSLQNTILATFPRDRVLTPKTVRGDYDTVLEAVQGMGDMDMEMKGGWPLVDDTRGMILFVLDYQSINIACREGVREVSRRARDMFYLFRHRVMPAVCVGGGLVFYLTGTVNYLPNQPSQF